MSRKNSSCVWLGAIAAGECLRSPTASEGQSLVLGASIGSGSQGTVYRGSFRGEPVAIKKISHSFSQEGVSTPWRGESVEGDSTSRGSFSREAERHQRATELAALSGRSSGILPMLVAGEGSGFLYVVTPIFAFDLRKTMPVILKLQHDDNELYKKVVFGFFASMVSALEIFQQAGFVHRDLKPENISLDTQFDEENGSISWRAFDYGLAKEEGVRSEFQGTASYAAPESLAENKSVYASDFWAVGHILFEIMGILTPMKREMNYGHPAVHVVAKQEEASEQMKKAEGLQSSLRELPLFFEAHENAQQIFLKNLNDAKSFEACVWQIAEAMHDTLPDLRPTREMLSEAVKILERHVTPATKKDYDDFIRVINTYKEPKVVAPSSTWDFDELKSESDDDSDSDSAAPKQRR